MNTHTFIEMSRYVIQGRSRLYLTVTQGLARCRYSIPDVDINPDDWNPLTRTLRSDSPDADKLNPLISSLPLRLKELLKDRSLKEAQDDIYNLLHNPKQITKKERD